MTTLQQASDKRATHIFYEVRKVYSPNVLRAVRTHTDALCSEKLEDVHEQNKVKKCTINSKYLCVAFSLLFYFILAEVKYGTKVLLLTLFIPG